MSWRLVFRENIAVPLEWRVNGFEMIDSMEKFVAPVKDLLYDEEAEKIRYVIATMGGGIGIRGKDLVIPLAMISDGGSGTLVVNSTAEHMSEAPMVENIENPDRDFEEKMFRHYGVKPYWEEEAELEELGEKEKLKAPPDVGTPTMEKDDN